MGFLSFLFLLIVALLALNVYLARILPGGEWFFLRWSGARAFLVEHIEPYGTAIAQRVQEVAYGRPALSGEYPYILNDPFYVVLLYTPLAVLPEFASMFFPSIASSLDFPIARGVWMLLSEAALVGAVLFAIDLSEWKPPRWLFILLIGFGLFGFYSVGALISGSPAIFLSFIYLNILRALRSRSDELAGALMFLVSCQWEMGGLFLLLVVVWAIANRRWNVWVGFGMSLFIVLVVSFLSYPGWGLPYVRAVLSDWYQGADLNLVRILHDWFPNSRFPLGTLVPIALGVILLIECLGSTQAGFRRLVWTSALSLAVTPLMGFAIFPSNHVVLIFPAILILALVWERWTRYRGLASGLILVLALLVPFGIYLRGNVFSNPLFSDLHSVLPPVAAIIGLYWMRWWVVRSPRTWLDEIEAGK